jgi:hypothetical protein
MIEYHGKSTYLQGGSVLGYSEDMFKGLSVRLDRRAFLDAQARLDCPLNHSPRVYVEGKKTNYTVE